MRYAAPPEDVVFRIDPGDGQIVIAANGSASASRSATSRAQPVRDQLRHELDALLAQDSAMSRAEAARRLGKRGDDPSLRRAWSDLHEEQAGVLSSPSQETQDDHPGSEDEVITPLPQAGPDHPDRVAGS